MLVGLLRSLLHVAHRLGRELGVSGRITIGDVRAKILLERCARPGVSQAEILNELPRCNRYVLSSDMLQPVLWRGIERAEYQIGVSICGKNATCVVICPKGSNDCLTTANTDEPTNQALGLSTTA